MKHNFKFWDRVRVYDRICVYDSNIKGFNGDEYLIIEEPKNGSNNTIHFKQCRKLKPKKRREWWINLQEIDTGSFKMAAGEHRLNDWFNNPYGEFIRTTPPPNKEGWIKVREVKE